MKDEQKNLNAQLFILIFPFLLALFLMGLLKNGEYRYIILVGPLGLALFHFRGKVWLKHWYSKIECIIWGIGWLVADSYFFSRLYFGK
jgi:hypothetical protein